MFSAEEISSITKSVEGRTVTLDELQKTANKITQLYLDKGANV
ncbi:MAG: POTRA domain-containing protein [Deinococcota bacterium]